MPEYTLKGLLFSIERHNVVISNLTHAIIDDPDQLENLATLIQLRTMMIVDCQKKITDLID